MKFLALCLLLAAGYCMAGVSRSNTYSVFYNSLPDELKQPFLKYQLALATVEQAAARSKARSHPSTDNLLTPEGLGLPETTFFKLETLNTPFGFSMHLYTLVTQDLGLNFDQVISLITKSDVCSTPGCWDLGDVGNHCC